MPNPFICKTYQTLLIAAATLVLGVATAQTPAVSTDTGNVAIKPAEWKANLAPSIGSASAPIQVVFFVDYDCPTCRTTDPQVRSLISKRHDVALIYREFPMRMHKLALPAAIVVENARAKGTFDLAHQELMKGQSLTEKTINEAARKAGVSSTESATTTKRLAADRSFVRTANVTYVPSFAVITHGKSTLMSRQQFLDFLKK